MKILVASYSYIGNCQLVADFLCAQFGWRSGVITNAEPRTGSARCVLDSLLRRKSPIRYSGPSPESFDRVVLVAPAWVYRLASPMRTLVHAQRAHLPRVAMVSLISSAGAANAVLEVSRRLGHLPMPCAAFTAQEIESGGAAGRLRAFGE